MANPRTASEDLKSRLIEAIGDLPYSRWAADNGLSPAAVHIALNGKPFSLRAENAMRTHMGWPTIEPEYRVVRLYPNQRVVTKARKRKTVTRAIRVSSSVADYMDSVLRELGFSSFDDWWKRVGYADFKKWIVNNHNHLLTGPDIRSRSR